MKRLILLSLLVAPLAAANDDVDAFEFDVYLDKKPIGYHNFELTRDGSNTRLSTEAKFDVKVLFVTAFRYQHTNTETWQNDCLIDINAQTDANGKLSVVTGKVSGEAFQLAEGKDTGTYEGCIKTFAYWNPSILEADRLLNSQTGEYEDVETRFEGDELLAIAGRQVPTRRYKLVTRRGDIHLWYAAEGGQWLALDAPAKGKRRIRYEARDVPETDALQALLR